MMELGKELFFHPGGTQNVYLGHKTSIQWIGSVRSRPMREILDIQKQLLPDLMDIMKKRYSILHHILVSGVVGRRTLASSLDMTERVLRGEVDFLKELGLLESDASGMKISESGRQLLEDMQPIIKMAFGLTDLEESIAKAFQHLASDHCPRGFRHFGIYEEGARTRRCSRTCVNMCPKMISSR